MAPAWGERKRATAEVSNHRARCERCGARYGIRVHYDRRCRLVRGEHLHRLSRCGFESAERRENP